MGHARLAARSVIDAARIATTSRCAGELLLLCWYLCGLIDEDCACTATGEGSLLDVMYSCSMLQRHGRQLSISRTCMKSCEALMMRCSFSVLISVGLESHSMPGLNLILFFQCAPGAPGTAGPDHCSKAASLSGWLQDVDNRVFESRINCKRNSQHSLGHFLYLDLF